MKDGPHKSPLWRFVSMCKKYNVYNVIANDIEKGVYVSMTEWKSLVKRAIWDKANRCYKASYSMQISEVYKPGYG